MVASRIVWDEKRTLHLIKLNPEQVKVTSLGHEAVITLRAGDRHFEAMVPTLSLGEDLTFVPAEQIGRRGEELIVVLPTGNDGTTKWYITEEELSEISL